jgi:hypothetical protein
MNVAWQFAAWKQFEKAFRPVGYGMIVVRRFARGLRMATECHIEPNHTVSTRRPFLWRHSRQ